QIEPSSLYAEYGRKEDDEWYAVYKGLKALMREHFKGRHLGRAPLKPDEWIQWAADLNVELRAKVVKFIDDLDGVPKESPSPRASSHKRARNEKTEPLDPRTRNSLLRIIRALEVM